MPDETVRPIRVEFTLEFKRNVRQLAKKYRHFQSDIQLIISQLEAGLTPGDQIPRTGYTVFKVRVKNSDIQKGKRSGYRMIYYLVSVKWWIAGGWAIELFVGRSVRGHSNLEVGCFRLDFEHVIAQLPGWELMGA